MLKDKEGNEYLSLGEQWALMCGNLVRGFIGSFILGWIAYELWNGIVSDIFHAQQLTYWQAWGTVYLINVVWPYGKAYVLKAK